MKRFETAGWKERDLMLQANIPINHTDAIVLAVLLVLFFGGVRVVIGFFREPKRTKNGKAGDGKQIVIALDGMMCGMCESHIKDAIRRSIPEATAVAASHSRGEASFRLNEPEDEQVLSERLHREIDPLGYRILEVTIR